MVHLLLLGGYLYLLVLRVSMAIVHDVLLRGELVLVCIVVEVVAAIHALIIVIVPR